MKINNKKHFDQPWIVHELLPDFEVEDVWKFPITLNEEHHIPLFYEQLMQAMEKVMEKGMAGQLFKFRLFLGRIFGWDEEPDLSIKKLPAHSIRARYLQKNNLTIADLPVGNRADFLPVYSLVNEALAELENQTVHAALHLGKVPENEKYTVQMAIYVKYKGWFSKFYMALIKPFRLAIVYPAMMRVVQSHWADYVLLHTNAGKET